MGVKHSPCLALLLVLLGSSCGGKESPRPETAAAPRTAVPAAEKPPEEKLAQALNAAAIPQDMARRIMDNAGTPGAARNGAVRNGTPPAPAPGAFLAELEKILAGDPFLRVLVDKEHPLPADYEPDDLVELRYGTYQAGIADTMMLRQKAEEALEAMAAAAKKEGITLTVSSAYRSYAYQVGSFDRWTRRLGLEEAERVSARPGKSQHQLGLVADFGSINNSFARTAAGTWTAAHAGRFGWSLSYPQGYEALTGYAWESWHYRYVGRELAAFISEWFGGIQQHALRFIHEWETLERETRKRDARP